MSLLAVAHLSKSFGGVRAVHDVSFELEAGEILALIGAGLSSIAPAFLTCALLIGLGSVAVQVLVPYVSHMAPASRRASIFFAASCTPMPDRFFSKGGTWSASMRGASGAAASRAPSRSGPPSAP